MRLPCELDRLGSAGQELAKERLCTEDCQALRAGRAKSKQYKRGDPIRMTEYDWEERSAYQKCGTESEAVTESTDGKGLANQ